MMFPKASYKAPIPKPSSIQVRRPASLGETIYGEYHAVRDVFADYYAAFSRSEQCAPHMLFAHCGSDAASISAFTREWGPLAPNTDKSLELSGAFRENPEPSGELCFAFRTSEWRYKQSQFKKALEVLSSAAIRRKQELTHLWPHWTLATRRTGGISVEMDFGTPVAALKRLWIPQYAKNEAEVIDMADKMGIFAPRDPRAGQFCLKLVCSSLWDAFWLMLAFDLTDETRFGKCANPSCGKLLRTRKPNQKYCDVACGQRRASLQYYFNKGKARRQHQRGRVQKLNSNRPSQHDSHPLRSERVALLAAEQRERRKSQLGP